jgi:hypothetical protein
MQYFLLCQFHSSKHAIRFLQLLVALTTVVFPMILFGQECVDGNCVNGKGTMVYKSNHRYEGEFRDGKRHGQGTMYLPLDRVISGQWQNDHIVEGTMVFADGTQYTGQWKYGYRDGKGELTFADGRKYIGEFRAGKRHGQGTLIYPVGRVYTGEFQEGKRTGYGTMTYSDGSKKTGRFKNGEYLGP